MKKVVLAFSALVSFSVSFAQNPDANRLMIKKGDKTGYIDTLGKEIIAPVFASGSQFSEGIAIVAHTSSKGLLHTLRYTFINDKMDVVIPTVFDGAGDFSEGLARVKVGEKWGYINKEGKTAIEPQFTMCEDFHEGHARASEKGKWGLINKKGEWAVQPVYHSISEFSDGVFAGQKETNGKWVFYHLNETIAIKDTFDKAGFFADGLAPVKKNEKWGFINKSGKLVIDYQYISAREFSGGLACVEKDYANWGFIDTAGNTVIDFQFNTHARFRFNHALVFKDNGYAYINRKGEFIWKEKQQ